MAKPRQQFPEPTVGGLIFNQENKIFFVCRTRSSKVKLNREGQEYAWATIDEALKLPLEPYTRMTVSKYKRQKN